MVQGWSPEYSNTTTARMRMALQMCPLWNMRFHNTFTYGIVWSYAVKTELLQLTAYKHNLICIFQHYSIIIALFYILHELLIILPYLSIKDLSRKWPLRSGSPVKQPLSGSSGRVSWLHFASVSSYRCNYLHFCHTNCYAMCMLLKNAAATTNSIFIK